MTDEKKSKYIRLSSEYYGGFTVTYQYVQMKDDEPIINFYTYESIDEGWFVIENDGKEKWLLEKGFKYHSLLMDKPRGGNYHWIDNHLVKATRYNGKFTNVIEKTVKSEVFDDDFNKNK